MKYSRKPMKNCKQDPLSVWAETIYMASWNIWVLGIPLVTVLAIAANYVTTSGTFVFDDRESLVKNSDVNNLSTPISYVFTHDFWGKNINSSESHKSYRPLTIIVLRIQHWLAGSLNPSVFHKFSVGLHVINSLTCLVVTSVIFGQLEEHKEGILLACTLFAVHPIHTESVASIVGQADMLYTFFCLLGFLIYHYALIEDKYNTDNEFLTNVKYLLMVSLLTAISMMSKEQGLMTTVICSLYDIVIHEKEICRLLTGDRNTSRSAAEYKEKKLLKCLLYLVFRISVMVAVTMLLLVFRFRLMVSQPVFSKHDNPHSFVEKPLLRLVNYSYIYWLNTWLLLNPWWLCCDWSYDCIPVLHSLSDFRISAAVAFWMLMLFMTFTVIKTWNTPNTRKIQAALIFLVVPFIPASNIFFRVGFVIAERNLYLPCLGLCIVVAVGFSALLEQQPYNSQILHPTKWLQ